MIGSNTIAVGPGRSADGSTMLAINSHQPWTGPVAWYEAHVKSEEGWNMIGGTFPGAPLILHGHNQDLGWAYTVNKPDLIDVFVLDINPENPDQYRFDGIWKTLEVRQAPIEVKLWGPVRWTFKREVLWSVYGPVVRQPHGTYAVRFAGMGSVHAVEQWYRMNRARSLEEWMEAQRMLAIPMFNVGYADREGNIFYLYNGQLPMRAQGYEWDQYVPGDTSATLWTEYLPLERLPQVLNPASGFIQNANSTPFQTTSGADNPDSTAYAASFGIETHMTNRAWRSLETFGQDSSITATEFMDYKYDMAYSKQSHMASFVRRVVAYQGAQDELLTQAIAHLKEWDLQTDPENLGAALAVRAFDEWMLDANPVVETDTLLDRLRGAASNLQTHFGRLDVPWQDVNRLQRDTLDLGVGGGPDILHAVYGHETEDGRLAGWAGDCYVLIVAWRPDGTLESHSIHQFGSATLDASSKHYADQAPLFVQRQLKPVWFNESDIRANLSRAYRPGR